MNKNNLKSETKSLIKSKSKSEHVLFRPSEEQQHIIDAIKRGENIAVNAVAGSGKTTTILGIASQIPDKKILQITYNRALKLEVEKKAKLHNLDNLKVLTFHGLACSYYDYTSYTDDRIQDILKENKPLNKPSTSIRFEIVIIDEIQDMTMLYFELVHKFLYDIRRKVVLGIMGDNFQGIYGFKGADERFLTLGDHIFINHKPFTKLTLHTSYRLTEQMAHFVNNVMVGGNPRIRTIKSGSPVGYIQYPCDKLTDYVYELIISEMKTNGYKNEDVFILTGTLRNQRIKDLENKLVSKGLLCFVPISEDAKLDERLIKDKIVFTTFHQSKGRERKLTIVYGFDTSYYDTFRDKTSSQLICPNLLYVATTRASSKLIVVEHIDYKQALPFLKMPHTNIGKLEYVNMHRHYSLNNHRNIDCIRPFIRNESESVHDKSVTDLVKFIDERTLSILANLLNTVFTVIAESTEKTIVMIPGDIKTGSNTYEQVCDINGVAIPAMLFSASTEYKHVNYLWKYLVHTYLVNSDNTFRNKNSSFILGYIHKLREKGLKTIDDWLLLSNIFQCATEGFNYKLKQITNYNWLSADMVARCHLNINRFIDRSKSLHFEVSLGVQMDDKGVFYGFNIPEYGNVKIRARIDCMTDDTIWELKCVEMLSIEHMLQVVIYAWIWKNIVTGEANKELGNEKRKLISRIINDTSDSASDNASASDNNIYQFRKFKLLNIRTGEVRELDTKSHYIDEIMNVLLESKLRIREQLSDDQFIEQCISRVEKYKYISSNLSYNYNKLTLNDLGSDDNYEDDNENNHNIELDF